MPFYLIGLVTRGGAPLARGREAEVRQALRDAAVAEGCEAFGAQARPDHAHVLVHAPDDVAPVALARAVRDRTAKALGGETGGPWSEHATYERVPLTRISGVMGRMETDEAPADGHAG